MPKTKKPSEEDLWKGRAILKKLRLAAGMTQEDLAPLVGVRVTQVSRWERGTNKPGAESLAAIVAALPVDASALLSGELRAGGGALGESRVEYEANTETAAAIEAYLADPDWGGDASPEAAALLRQTANWSGLGVQGRAPAMKDIHRVREAIEMNLAGNDNRPPIQPAPSAHALPSVKAKKNR